MLAKFNNGIIINFIHTSKTDTWSWTDWLLPCAFTSTMLFGGRCVNALSWYDSTSGSSDRQIAECCHLRLKTLTTVPFGTRYEGYTFVVGI